ncbi:MAG: GGDEF domain-containing protein [Spirochaetales bacterium]|nr:GGDEF domain-containing protein [Spirochaetales bacterium]
MEKTKEESELSDINSKISLSLANEINRKRFMHHIMTISGITVLLAMSLMALLKGDMVLFLSDLFFALTLGFLLYRIRNVEKIDPIVITTLIIIMFFFLYLFLTWKAEGWSFFWFFTYPIISLFMLGNKKGLLLSLTFLFLAIGCFYILNNYGSLPNYPKGVITRLSFTYLLITFLTYAFEQSRHESENLLQESMDELKDKAIRDGLTGLYNRRYLEEILGLMKRDIHSPPRVITFIMADIDFFKKYNDTYGHQKGDEILRKIAQALQGQIRRKTDYVFRYGGEEFSLLLYGSDEKTTIELCQDILDSLEELNIPHEGSHIGRVSLSLGAVIGHTGQNCHPEDIVKSADDALYEAKESGRNSFVFKKE